MVTCTICNANSKHVIEGHLCLLRSNTAYYQRETCSQATNKWQILSGDWYKTPVQRISGRERFVIVTCRTRLKWKRNYNRSLPFLRKTVQPDGGKSAKREPDYFRRVSLQEPDIHKIPPISRMKESLWFICSLRSGQLIQTAVISVAQTIKTN